MIFMAIIRKKDLYLMGNEALRLKLFELKRELYSQRGSIASGAKAQNPGRIKEIRRTIARILTILSRKGEDKNKKEKSRIPASSPMAPGGAGQVDKKR